MGKYLRAYKSRIAQFNAPAPLKDFSDYDDYWHERGDLDLVPERWRIAASYIPSGASLLDIGCGSGEFLEYLKFERPDVRGCGADYSEVSVARARKRGFHAFQIDLGSEDIPGEYDCITSLETLEHIPDAEAAIVRLRDASRGRLIVSIPNIGAIDFRIRLALFGRFPVTNCVMHIKEHVRHWTVRDFTEWTEHFGLEIVSMHGTIGGRFLPWRTRPNLWSAGIVYVLEKSPTAPKGR